MEVGAARARSAAVWVAAALVLVAVAGLAYLRPSLAPPAPAASPRAAGSGDEQLVGASFADANRGAVSVVPRPVRQGTRATSYVTSDGGRTWSRGDRVVYLEPPMAVELGSQSRLSADGGQTWRPLAVPEAAANTTLPTFLDPRHGWWVVEVVSPDQETRIWRTDDGGGSWQALAASGLPTDAAPVQLRWVDPLRGVLSMNGAGGPSLFLTEDAGATWRQSLTPVSPLPGTRPHLLGLIGRRSRLLAWLVAFPTTSGAYRDTYTYVQTSGDGGRTWGSPIAGPHLHSVSLGAPAVDSRGRLLLLEGRRLLVSEDDGTTWTARVIQAPSGDTPEALVQAAGSALFATAISGRVATTDRRFVDRLLRSTDGGAHWDQVRLPPAG